MEERNLENLVFTETELARLLKIGVQSLRNNRHMGRGFPYVKIGRSVRYLGRDIFNCLNKRRIDPAAR
jgi:hypothetical protein